ncbi:hypothetical protein ACWEQL_27835 [Kitasatospora sp. NPDC004240]
MSILTLRGLGTALAGLLTACLLTAAAPPAAEGGLTATARAEGGMTSIALHRLPVSGSDEEPEGPFSVLTADSATAVSENPLWAKASTFFNGAGEKDVWRKYEGAAGRTGDDGIVMLRVFIPHKYAAGPLLEGDNRGFTNDPSAGSRATIVWNTATGDVAVTVSHSTRPDPDPATPQPLRFLAGEKTIPALGLTNTTSMDGAFAERDKVRFDNRVGLDPESKTTGTLHARLSLLNSATNGQWWPAFGQGAWSVDQEFTIARIGNTYRLTQLTGNGYPAIEAYYYPRYAADSAAQSTTLARRSVDPNFQHSAIDNGGGLAALDSNSWVTCTSSHVHSNGSRFGLSDPGSDITVLTCQDVEKTISKISWATSSDQAQAL